MAPNREIGNAIRVAFVITELEVGGAERCLVSLATGLDRERFAPVVYSLAPRPEDASAELVEALEAANTPIRFLGATSRLHFYAAYRRLSQELKQDPPHVVQTFLYHANVLGSLAARSAGLNRVITGVRVADPRWSRWRIERFATRRVARVACVSAAVARFAQEKMGYAPEKLIVIPNGIDVSRFPAERAADLAQFGIPPGKKAMVCVARLEEQKGVDWLIECAPRLLERLPNHDLLMVGEGPLRHRLERQAAKIGNGQRVHFAGQRKDVPEILRASELLLLPSRWEGMPNVVLEAMASERPVVAADVEGVREILGPLANEQTFACQNEIAFRERALAILTNSAQREQLALENRKRVEANFSREVMLGAYGQLYQSLVQ